MRRAPYPRTTRWATRATLVAAALALAGCSSLPDWSPTSWLPSVREADTFLGLITPYRMDIVQGNVVTREQTALVKPGMTRAQVRNILGSPMLTDMFHTDRWDYAFTIRRQGTEPQRRSVVVYFKDDRLDRIEAPDLPSEKEFVAAISQSRRSGPPPALELTPAQRQALPAPPPAKASTTPDNSGPLRDYPPLEPS